jgi:hypothetical protein
MILMSKSTFQDKNRLNSQELQINTLLYDLELILSQIDSFFKLLDFMNGELEKN